MHIEVYNDAEEGCTHQQHARMLCWHGAGKDAGKDATMLAATQDNSVYCVIIAPLPGWQVSASPSHYDY